MMNVFNKLFTWGISQLTTKLTDETPSHINYLWGFVLWIGLPLIGLIPAFAVEEDLRRLNMKDVQESKYISDQTLMNKTANDRQEFYRNNKVIANQDVLELFFVMEEKRFSHQINSRLEKMTTAEDDEKLSRRRFSGSTTHSRMSEKEKPFKRLGSNVAKLTVDKDSLLP